MPHESWLRSSSHERFADAMVKCQHPFAICAQDGRCSYGDCFRIPKQGRPEIEARLDRIEKAIKELQTRTEGKE